MGELLRFFHYSDVVKDVQKGQKRANKSMLHLIVHSGNSVVPDAGKGWLCRLFGGKSGRVVEFVSRSFQNVKNVM